MRTDHWDGIQNDVFLLHFGGPTSSAEVQPFLTELFEDPFILRVLLPEGARKALGRFIARRRVPKADSQYRVIGYSPINRYTDIQARHLEKKLREIHPNTNVHVINRYTAPRAVDVVRGLDTRVRRRVFLLTLYPHFSHATAGSSMFDFDKAWRLCHGSDHDKMTRVSSWWHQRDYLEYSWELLRESLQSALDASARSGDPRITVLFSAHGLPVKYLRRGDPYPHEIRAHFAELEARARKWLPPAADVAFELSFQSRVGPVEWLRPYTEDMIARLGRERGGQLVMVPVSFVSDHIETLYEMDVTYKADAAKAGFTGWHRVTMPNDDERLAHCLRQTLVTHGF
ncbi:ferrochelatase [bacterium]|nr:ferrochelatase [bacterium]